MDREFAHFDVEMRERLRFAYEAEVASGKTMRDLMNFEDHRFTVGYAKYILEFLDMKLPTARVWLSPVPAVCEVGNEPIRDEFYDARLATGTAWACMCPTCWKRYGTGIFGTGYGQHYRRRADGQFVKIEG